MTSEVDQLRAERDAARAEAATLRAAVSALQKAWQRARFGGPARDRQADYARAEAAVTAALASDAGAKALAVIDAARHVSDCVAEFGPERDLTACAEWFLALDNALAALDGEAP